MTAVQLSPPLRAAMQDEVGLEAVRLMTQVALLAVCSHRPQDAETIVDGLVPVFGEYAAVAMARATVATATGRQREALALLESLSEDHPQFTAIRCAYAMLRKELGLSGWQAIAERIADDPTDPQAAQVAEMLLQDAPRRNQRRVAPSLEAAGVRFA